MSKLGEVLGELERLAHDHAAGFAREEFVDRLAVDDELALAGLEEDARYCALAPSRAVVVVADHVRSPVLWVAAPRADAAVGVDLEFPEHRVAERALRQHALHRVLERARPEAARAASRSRFP